MRKKLSIYITILLLAVVLGIGAIFGVNMVNFRNSNAEVIAELSLKVASSAYDDAKNMVKENLKKDTEYLARIYNVDFSVLRNEILMLSDFMTNIYSNPDKYGRAKVEEPNPSVEDYELNVQLLFEEGVNKNDPKLREEIGLAANCSNLITQLVANGTTPAMYISSESGFSIIADLFTKEKLDENNNPIPINARQRSWYTLAKAKNSAVLTNVTKDAYSDYLIVSCGAPFYDADGNIAGVCGGDLYIAYLSNSIKDIGNDLNGYACVLDKNGKVIISYVNGELEAKNYDGTHGDLLHSNNEDLRDLAEDALKGNTGVYEIKIDGDWSYVAYAPLSTIGWSLLSVVPFSTATESAAELVDNIGNISYTVASSADEVIFRTNILVTFLAVILLILGVILSRIVARKLVKPIQILTDEVNKLDGENLDFNWEYNFKDETDILGHSFEALTRKMQEYIENLTEVTAEKERIGAELNVAKKIQADMLPSTFPAFPKIPQIDIYATMTPAKEVGGDFYNFFRIDRRHIGLVMADVSGKGVPAALFMVVCKTLIENQMLVVSNQKPSEILFKVNNALCKNNDEMMFCTCWIGILNIETGHLRCASAGHEYPFVKSGEGGFSMFKDPHGVPLAAMSDSQYEDYDMYIEPGGAIYVCTDGVTEATNVREELFERYNLTNALNKDYNASAQELLLGVKESIDNFCEGAPQFDDITMLCLKYFGHIDSNEDVIRREINLGANVDNFLMLHDELDDLLEKTGCPDNMRTDILICVEEIFVNVASYAYGNDEGDIEIHVEIGKDPYAVTMQFKDRGIPYNPLQKEDPDITLPAAKRKVGGLGIYFVKKLMDEVWYKYEDGYNILNIIKEEPWE